jgi:plastocyanin
MDARVEVNSRPRGVPARAFAFGLRIVARRIRELHGMRRAGIELSALLFAAALSLSGRATESVLGGEEHPARVAVSIEDYAYQPDPVTIAPGTTVIWTNRDEVQHTVVSDHKLFSSPELEANQHYEFTFKKVGNFAYHCSLHPEMKGEVIVK